MKCCHFTSYLFPHRAVIYNILPNPLKGRWGNFCWPAANVATSDNYAKMVNTIHHINPFSSAYPGMGCGSSTPSRVFQTSLSSATLSSSSWRISRCSQARWDIFSLQQGLGLPQFWVYLRREVSPCGENSFQLLVSLFRSFGLLTTIGEGRNVDPLVNLELCLLSQLPLHHSSLLQHLHYWWCCTTTLLHLTLHFRITPEQDLEILKRLHLG